MNQANQCMPANDTAGRTTNRWDGLLRAAVRFVVALAVSLPLCLLLWPHLPLLKVPAVWGMGLDRLLLLLVVLGVLLFLLKRYPLISYGAVILALGTATYRSFHGDHDLRSLFKDYKSAFAALSQTTEALPDAKELHPFKGAEELRTAMDYKDPAVRSFAVRAATTWFTAEAEGDDRTLVQSFSIFKVINSGWIYVSDPADAEYFASAKESIGLLAGDCDDHAVLMASCIKAIGGKVRLVRTTGHIYPEMCVGKAKGMQHAANLIRNELFPEEARYADLYYHTDANGDCWINLDYTRHYPGGPVMNEKIIGILHV